MVLLWQVLQESQSGGHHDVVSSVWIRQGNSRRAEEMVERSMGYVAAWQELSGSQGGGKDKQGRGPGVHDGGLCGCLSRIRNGTGQTRCNDQSLFDADSAAEKDHSCFHLCGRKGGAERKEWESMHAMQQGEEP